MLCRSTAPAHPIIILDGFVSSRNRLNNGLVLRRVLMSIIKLFKNSRNVPKHVFLFQIILINSDISNIIISMANDNISAKLPQFPRGQKSKIDWTSFDSKDF